MPSYILRQILLRAGFAGIVVFTIVWLPILYLAAVTYAWPLALALQFATGFASVTAAIMAPIVRRWARALADAYRRVLLREIDGVRDDPGTLYLGLLRRAIKAQFIPFGDEKHSYRIQVWLADNVCWRKGVIDELESLPLFADALVELQKMERLVRTLSEASKWPLWVQLNFSPQVLAEQVAEAYLLERRGQPTESPARRRVLQIEQDVAVDLAQAGVGEKAVAEPIEIPIEDGKGDS